MLKYVQCGMLLDGRKEEPVYKSTLVVEGERVREVETGWVLGPRLVLSGLPIYSTGGHGWFLGIEADGQEGVRTAVRENIKTGVDMVKMIITGGVTTPGSTLIRTCFTEPEIQAAIIVSGDVCLPPTISARGIR